MAVAFDAVGPSSSGTATDVASGAPGPLSWSHTCSGTNRVVIVGVAAGNEHSSDAAETLSVTFGGTAMTSLGLVHSNNNTTGFVQLFGLINPPTGSSTVVVTAGGTWNDTGDSPFANSLVAGSVSFTGADQTSPFGTAASAAGDGSSQPSVAVSSASGHMVVDIVGTGTQVNSSAQTDQWLDNFTVESAAGNAAMSTASGTSSVTMGYNVDSDWWGMLAVDISAAAAGISPVGVPWLTFP